jgi:hypothetical protein
MLTLTRTYASVQMVSLSLSLPLCLSLSLCAVYLTSEANPKEGKRLENASVHLPLLHRIGPLVHVPRYIPSGTVPLLQYRLYIMRYAQLHTPGQAASSVSFISSHQVLEASAEADIPVVRGPRIRGTNRGGMLGAKPLGNMTTQVCENCAVM